MFNLFQKNKKYVSCKWLESCINFGGVGIYNCCYFVHSNKNDTPLSLLTPDNKYNLNDFLKKKNQMKKLHQKGIIHERCQGCCCLEYKEWDSKFIIKKLVIGPNFRCNANCIYCYTHNRKKFYNSRQDIPIFDILKKLVNKKLVDKDCEIEFNNGEPTIMDRFEDILNLFINNKIGKILVSSSGIEYSEILAKGLALGQCNLIISPDSGNRELYKKIKCVDKYDLVWRNIKKYADSVKNKNQFKLKYIIIPSVNDNEENVREFIDKVKENGVDTIPIDIEMNWYKSHQKNKQEMQSVLKLIKYMETYIVSKCMSFEHCPAVNAAVYLYPSLYEDSAVNL